jgi:hypothetical protein
MVERLKNVGDKPVIPRDVHQEIPKRLGRGLDSASERTMTCHDLRVVFGTAGKMENASTSQQTKTGRLESFCGTWWGRHKYPPSTRPPRCSPVSCRLVAQALNGPVP